MESEMTKKYQIRGCIGCGVCSSLKPEIFKVDEDGMAEINYQDAKEEDVEEVSKKCPVGAIIVKE